MSANQSAADAIKAQIAAREQAAQGQQNQLQQSAAQQSQQEQPEQKASGNVQQAAPTVTLTQEQLTALMAKAAQEAVAAALAAVPKATASETAGYHNEDLSSLSQAAAIVKAAEQPVDGREYFHSIPGSKFHYQVGPGLLEELVFIGGRAITRHPAAIAALDAVANKAGSLITTVKELAQATKIVSGEAASDIAAIAARSQERMVAAGERTY